MSIYNTIISKTYQPYFYIIRHKPSGKLYAGCKYAKRTSIPSTFMTENGYQTSSRFVKSLIEKDGLDSFEILRIDIYCDGLHVAQYERNFLHTVDACNNDLYINMNNGGGIDISSESNISKKEEIKQRKRETCMKNYGVDHYSKTPEGRERKRLKTQEKYGVDHYRQNPEACAAAQSKYVKNLQETYGEEITNVMHLDHVKNKVKTTFEERYGPGITNAMQTQHAKDKKIQTCLEKYGHTSASFQFLCVLDTKKSYTKSMLSRWRPEFKLFY